VAVPAPHPWRTEGEGVDEVARRALLAFVSAPQVLLDSGVGGAGVDEGGLPRLFGAYIGVVGEDRPSPQRGAFAQLAACIRQDKTRQWPWA
jgi:hypothetical protein